MKSAPNTAIADQLIQMAKLDQEMREQAQEDASAWKDDIDRTNTARLKEIVREIGWPTISTVGPEASRAAWLLVQHAYAEPDFMKQCLDLMKAAKTNDIAPANVAFLEDRLLTLEGKPQLYGTQFRNVGNGWEPFPIADPLRVDELRASVGLGTLAENMERIRTMYR